MILVIRGINIIVVIINFSNENLLVRYNVFLGDIFGSKIDKINIIFFIKSIEWFEIFFFFIVFSIIFFIGKWLVFLIGIYVLNEEMIIVIIIDIIILMGDIIIGIDIFCLREFFNLWSIKFKIIILIGIVINFFIFLYNIFLSINIWVIVFLLVLIFLNVLIKGRCFNVIIL